MKRCTKCGKLKEVTEFYKHPSGMYGVDSKCKQCVKKHQASIKNSVKKVVETKCCSQCGKTKSVDLFFKDDYQTDGYKSWCKQCSQLFLEKAKKKEKIEVTELTCCRCGETKPVKDFNKLSTSTTGYNYKCRECVKKHNNSPEGRKVINAYSNKRIKEDPDYKFRARMRSALSTFLSRAKYEKKKNKKNSWEFYLGYTISQLKDHLESKFLEGMSWENYGSEWELDHIIPIKYRNEDGTYYWNQEDLSNIESEEFSKCWALNNLQPLWSRDNIVKGNRFIG